MGRFQGQPTIDVYGARPLAIHNPAMNPLHSIYLERREGYPLYLYAAWMTDSCLSAELHSFITGKRTQLKDAGVQVSKDPRAPIKLHELHLPNGGGTLVVCQMECLEPQNYVTELAISRLFQRVGGILETPEIKLGWPRWEERHTNNAFLSRAVLLNTQH